MAAAMVEMAAAIFIQLPVLFDRWPSGQPPGIYTLHVYLIHIVMCLGLLPSGDCTPCDPDPCVHGSCTVDYGNAFNYSCTCDPGWESRRCNKGQPMKKLYFNSCWSFSLKYYNIFFVNTINLSENIGNKVLYMCAVAPPVPVHWG